MFSNPVWGELPALSDNVVIIEPFSQRDIPTMMSWNQDPEAQRWFDWPNEMPSPSQHEDHCVAVIEGWRRDWLAGRRAPFVVRHIVTREAVGSVELHLKDGDWFVSYLTHPEWRGRGIATRAVRLACRWAFSTLRAERIQLLAAEANPASCKVAHKTGFVDTGRRPISEPLVNFVPEVGATRTLVEYLLTRSRSADLK